MSRSSPLAHENSTLISSFFEPKKVVIVSKQSALEYELGRLRYKNKKVTNQQLLSELENRHANIADMRKRHEQQKSYVKAICDELKRNGIEYRVVNRHTYTNELVDWCDLVISAGGDGTFLTAASKIRSQVPVIGINTDPIGSEGHLCLTGKFYRPADQVIRQFLKNEFRWAYRQRIRVTMLDQNTSIPASSFNSNSTNFASNPNDWDLFLNEQKDSTLTASEYPLSQRFKFNSEDESDWDDSMENNNIKLSKPHIALNEVFIGESHSARVSYYDVQFDDGPLIKQKSSGMIICTGTGSTSWHYNTNRLTEQNLKDILGIGGQMNFLFSSDGHPFSTKHIDDSVLETLCKQFNQRLIFEPETEKMAFTIRDPVFNSTFLKTISRGFARRIRLKSRCTHAHLILDGSTSIPFNRGSEVILEIIPEDALRTVVLL